MKPINFFRRYFLKVLPRDTTIQKYIFFIGYQMLFRITSQLIKITLVIQEITLQQEQAH